jgi:hypothetical protein
MRTLFAFSLCALVSGCGNGVTGNAVDLGMDFSLPPQTTHVGATGNTCCMVTYGPEYALYLANPQPGTTDSQGRKHPATGDLHVTNPYGADYLLASKVPAYDYGFAPDGRFAIFATKAKNNYALELATLERPDFKQPPILPVIPDGVQDYQLFQQSFFSPDGRYLIIGILPGTIMSSPDLHVVDLDSGSDVFQLGSGAFSYLELMAPDGTMVFENDAASTTPGTPSVEGLYVGNLPAMIGGAQPALIDTHTAQASLMDDGHTLYYERVNGDLMMYDLANKYFVKAASNVAAFSTGPGRRGPLIWTGTDRSLHVAPKLGPEFLSLPPDSIDVFSPTIVSPDGDWLYYFKNLSEQNNNGDLYALKLPPAGDGVPHLIGQRISTVDLSFLQGKLLLVRNVDDTGATGDAVIANLDGTDVRPIASGIALGGLLSAAPAPVNPMQHHGIYTGPLDLSVPVYPPLFANLTGAQNDLTHLPISGASTVTGPLAFSRSLSEAELPLDPMAHSGQIEFSDDGYVLAYAGGVTWSDNARNYTGKLNLYPTLGTADITPVDLTGVSELGPIYNHALFVNAPDANPAGVYYIKY